MKSYAKGILYAYPFLQTAGKDYEEHIKNKGLLSYDSRWTAEGLAEYLAGEIIEMHNLEWLKAKLDEIFARLSEEEKWLLSLRYFGKKPNVGKKRWTERTYFRRQKRLLEKLTAMLALAGITEEVYERDFASVEIFRKINRCVESGKEEKISAKERRFFK